MTEDKFNNSSESIDELQQTKDFNIFWNNCQTLFKGSLLWGNILRIKKENVSEQFTAILSDFKKEDKDFGNRLLEAQKKEDYKEIGGIVFTLTLQHIIEVKKSIFKQKEDVIIKNLSSKLGQELVLPFFVFNGLIHNPISEKVNFLKGKQLKEYLALFVGLWTEIYEILRIEEKTYITNPRREKQINDFVGKELKGMTKYYDLLDSGLDTEELKREMNKLVKEYPNFLDSYLTLADILQEEDKFLEAEELLSKAYSRAMSLIVDKDGNFPKYIPWGVLENQHIVRAIDRWAYELWEKEREQYALEIFRKLLKSNPNDNIGARYEILAIRMDYEPDYAEEMFAAPTSGYIDAIKSEQWFKENAKKFPEEFNWWLKEAREDDEGK